MVLRLLEGGWRPDGIDLRDPVAAIKQVSRDETFKWLVERESGGTIGAVEIQRVFLEAAKERLSGLSLETDQVVVEWEEVLNRLESDPLSLSDTLDWAAKRSLLDEFRASENLNWNDPMMASLDLEYHNVDPAEGLYLALEQAGSVRRVLDDAEIEAARCEPPADSLRAQVRGLAASRFSDAVRSITWSRLTLATDEGDVTLKLDMLSADNPGELRAALANARTPTEFSDALRQLALPTIPLV